MSLLIVGVIQTAFQTLLILSASYKKCRGTLQKRTKPGREAITFLLIINLCLWILNTLIKGQAIFRPDHMEILGVQAWTIITHISMPLAIFYRFHSTVCLFEIWKSTYKN